MRIQRPVIVATLGLMLLPLQPTAATGAEIRVLSIPAVLEIMNQIGPQFERASGHKLSFRHDTAAAIGRQVQDGATFDIAIATGPVIGELVNKGKIAPDSIVNIGRSGLGVAVRNGAPKPDISTVDAFKRTLLAARSVVRSEGTSGVYFEGLMTRLGIADGMKSKIRIGRSGLVAETVATGEVELAVQQISEILPVAGVELLGPFPPEVQLSTLFSMGIGTGAKEPQAARELAKFLTSPAAARAIRAKGIDPAF